MNQKVYNYDIVVECIDRPVKSITLLDNDDTKGWVKIGDAYRNAKERLSAMNLSSESLYNLVHIVTSYIMRDDVTLDDKQTVDLSILTDSELGCNVSVYHTSVDFTDTDITNLLIGAGIDEPIVE